MVTVVFLDDLIPVFRLFHGIGVTKHRTINDPNHGSAHRVVSIGHSERHHELAGVTQSVESQVGDKTGVVIDFLEAQLILKRVDEIIRSNRICATIFLEASLQVSC